MKTLKSICYWLWSKVRSWFDKAVNWMEKP
jgi:hypothetical protein